MTAIAPSPSSTDVPTSRPKIIGYWVCLAFIALTIGAGGLAQALSAQSTEGMRALGYPHHFTVLLGVWKVLGTLVLLAPGFPLVKEWAYAGIVFDLSGAVLANAANSASAFHVLAPAAIIVVVVASWALRPESRRLRRLQRT